MSSQVDWRPAKLHHISILRERYGTCHNISRHMYDIYITPMCNTKEKTQLTYCAKGIQYQYFVYLLCINCKSIMSVTRIHAHEYTHTQLHTCTPAHIFPPPPPPTVSVNTTPLYIPCTHLSVPNWPKYFPFFVTIDSCPMVSKASEVLIPQSCVQLPTQTPSKKNQVGMSCQTCPTYVAKCHSNVV